jgi:hypothetical protein
VALVEMVVFAISEDAAYTLGTEHGQGSVGEQTVGIDWRVTNIYRREAEGWKIVQPPHRLLFGGGASPGHVGGPSRESSRAGG